MNSNGYCQDINVRNFVMHQAPPDLGDNDNVKRHKATNVEQQSMSSPHAAADATENTIGDAGAAHSEEQAKCTGTQVLSCAI